MGERGWKLKGGGNFLRSGGNFFTGDLGEMGYPSLSGRPVVLTYHCVVTYLYGLGEGVHIA